MRLRNITPGLGLILLAAVFLLWTGCSDDTTTVTADDGLTEGSPTDPEFVQVQGQINNYLDSTMEIFTVGLENLSHLPTDTDQVDIIHGPMGVNDTAWYYYVSGWHITYVSHYYQNFDFRFIDSIQFQRNSIALATPDSLDYMRFIRYWDLSSNFTQYTHTNANGHVDVVISNLDQDTATIGGINDIMFLWNYINGDTTINAVFDIDATASNVRVRKSLDYGWISGCPCSGSLTMAIAQSNTIHVNSTTAVFVRNWDVAVSYSSGQATVTVVSDNETWSYTYTVCSMGGS